MKIGLLLPHFGDQCTHERVFGQARSIEEAGFNSVWVRDHFQFHPHAFEGQSSLFLEPFTTLAGIATLTKKLILGTATVVTFRHPLVTSQLFGTLAYVAKGRIIAGMGAGTDRSQFAVSGLPREQRGKIVEEYLQILRLMWTQDHVSFHGEFYNFDDLAINPKPPADMPLYYGGMTRVGIRRTVTYCDGWLPQRTPFKILDGWLAYVRELEQQQQKKKPTAVSYFPLASIDRDSSKARQRIGIERIVQNLERMIREKNLQGITATEADLDGSIICGSPQECVDQLGKFKDRGYDEVVLDLRNTFDVWENSIELVAAEVLPHFREDT